MSGNDQELLAEFTRDASQDAFTELVNRHLNLVYCAALRQVRSPQLAEEVSLSVFTQLARCAATLAPNTVLTAWLYQVTRNAAIDVVRAEARRQAREQIAFEMSATPDADTNWMQIEPMLDEAMVSLEELDRTALLLRYFENKSLREVGDAIGASEDAAQKRVSRALDRLREFFAERKVGVGAAVLAALVSANAVQAAPVALVPVIATGATAASAALVASTASATAVAVTKTIAMTTIQKAIVAVVLAAAVATAIYQTREVSALREQMQTLKQQQEQRAALNGQLDELRHERDQATNALAALTAQNDSLKKNPTDVLKLRGEVGRLRKENSQMGSSSALSKVTANPEARKMMREQQKMGMSMIYKELAKQLKLTPEQTEKLNNLLADHIMTNVDNVTTVLRDKPAADELNAVFAAQDAALQQQLTEMLGADAVAKYDDYTKDLLGAITAEQFKDKLTGTKEEKAEKAKQLRQLIQEQTQAVLASRGLPADYQTVPTLNFRNFASEQGGEQGIKLLDDIFQQVAAHAGSFLSEAEIARFREFDAAAVTNNRGALALNRTLMAPISN